MGKVVLVDRNRIDLDSPLAKIDFVTTVDGVGDRTVLMDIASPIRELKDQTIYVPASLADTVKAKYVKVYHELALFPFFQQVKTIIQEKPGEKGVFRLRRVLEKMNSETAIWSDLCVLTSLFGEPERLVWKNSRADLSTSHVIVMAHFASGVMAHLDYTFSNKEIVELEWSGIGKIIEFHSEETKAIVPKIYATSPLRYSVDSILCNAVDWDVVRVQIQQFKRMVGGVSE